MEDMGKIAGILLTTESGVQEEEEDEEEDDDDDDEIVETHLSKALSSEASCKH